VTGRVYLDWNATAPLRPEARAAMLAAMDAVGNPSSIHAEGRAARAIVERARAQVAALVGCEPDAVVFTAGATEAAALAARQAQAADLPFCAHATEHDCVHRWASPDHVLPVDGDGQPELPAEGAEVRRAFGPRMTALAVANGETGVLARRGVADGVPRDGDGSDTRCPALMDAAQIAGRRPLALGKASLSYALLSAHKLGGPKGVGCLLNLRGAPLTALTRGGGQEKGARAGTENVIGIAGFGAAAEAASRDLEAGVWDDVEKLRNILENRVSDAAPDTIFAGNGAPRLPNTSCMVTPGWKGELQVMQLDLAGFAVSSGAACSSGKVGPSRVLRAMGFDETAATSAIRVSLGPTTTEDEIMRFADAWTALYAKRRARAA
jgi:cysteine desulfurase